MTELDDVRRDISKLEDRMSKMETSQAEFLGAWKAQYGEVIRRMEEGTRDRTQMRLDLGECVSKIERLYESLSTKVEQSILRVQTESRAEIKEIQTTTAAETRRVQEWGNRTVIATLTFALTTLVGIVLKILKVF